MSQAIFYHAGCPVCVEAEQQIVEFLKETPEVVHFGEAQNRVEEAERKGVKSVPALVINDTVFHINHGASMAEVRQSLGLAAENL